MKHESAIQKVRNQVIAHRNRMDGTNRISNFYEVASNSKFPSQFSQLALLIDLIEILVITAQKEFQKDYFDSHRNWTESRKTFEDIYFSQTRVSLEETRSIYADLQAKVISNFRRQERNEPLLK